MAANAAENQRNLPNFEQMHAALVTMRDNVARFANLPSVNSDAAILNHLEGIEQRMELMEQLLMQRIDSMDDGLMQYIDSMAERLGARIMASNTNSIARLHNSQLSAHNLDLMPLRNSVTNAPINAFPQTPAAISDLSVMAVADLLKALGESNDGDFAAGRQRLRRALGLKEVPI